MLWVRIVNISDLAEVSDYEIEVGVNRKIIATGVVKGHKRSDGWRALVRKVLESDTVEDVT